MFGFGGASGLSRDKTEAQRELGLDFQRVLSESGCWDLTGKLKNREHLHMFLQILRANSSQHAFSRLRRTSAYSIRMICAFYCVYGALSF